jgi:starvation-inducible DNA-binding protein
MQNDAVIKTLEAALADTFVVYFKTHSYHWNVRGPRFRALHEMFEEQYTEMWNALDEIAERILQLGAPAPANPAALMAPAGIAHATGAPKAQAMCAELGRDNRAVVATLYKALAAAQDAGDEGTVDLLTTRISVHEKAAWMLEASADEAA